MRPRPPSPYYHSPRYVLCWADCWSATRVVLSSLIIYLAVRALPVGYRRPIDQLVLDVVDANVKHLKELRR